MTRHLLPATFAFGLITSVCAQEPAPAAPQAAPAETKPAADPAAVRKDSSFYLGWSSGKQLTQLGFNQQDIDSESFLKGLLASFSPTDNIDQEKFKDTLQAMGDMLQEREKTRAADNLTAGKKFLEENGKREGVVTTKSGLQYEVLAKGGEEKYTAPKEGDTTTKRFLVNYKGSFLDGTQFDASPEGENAVFTLHIIEGIKEALTTMPVGSKWKVFVPAELGYGEERSGDIAPNSTLIFELELVKIEDAPADADGGFPIPIPAREE